MSITMQGAKIKNCKHAKNYLIWKTVVKFVIFLGTLVSNF